MATHQAIISGRTADPPAAMSPRVNPQAPRWRAMRAALRLASRVSDGIALGYRHGFDSGPMLDYVYRNRVQGKWLVGRQIDRVYLEQIGWRAIRGRRELLERTLRQLIAARRAGGAPTHIADIAAGPGR
ncbi:MAG: class I SAM-dependent methyltransferase family protein, partial [Thermomicrobiales bacterium]